MFSLRLDGPCSTLLISFLFPIVSGGAHTFYLTSNQGVGWNVRSSNGNISIEGQVPGVVHTSLRKAGIIDGKEGPKELFDSITKHLLSFPKDCS